MEEKTSGLIFIFIFIVLGVVLIGVLGDTIFENTNPTGAFNETLDITAARIGATGNIDESHAGFPLGTTSGRNVTSITSLKAVNGTTFVENTDWNLTIQRLYLMDGSIWVNYTGNDTVVTYRYESDLYVRHATSRTLFKLITLFFAIAIVVFVIFYVKKKYIDQI